MKDLEAALRRIDGRGYRAYKDLRGSYQFDHFQLIIDHVQGDPFAEPSRLRARMAMSRAGFPEQAYAPRPRRIALEDWLTRAFSRALRCLGQRPVGSGKSGLLLIDQPGQEILERSSARITADHVELRFKVGLPAAGRTLEPATPFRDHQALQQPVLPPAFQGIHSGCRARWCANQCRPG